MTILTSSSAEALERRIMFHLERGAVLAGNVANADTPNYRRRELSFANQLENSVANLERTDPRHLGTSGSSSGHRVEIGPAGTRPDGNGIDLDQEILTLHRNSGAFVNRANILARVSALTRTAITSS